MSADAVRLIRSRDNPLLKLLRRQARDGAGYRKSGRVWLEGDHLCGAAMARGLRPAIGVFSASFWAAAGASWAQTAIETIVIDDDLFVSISALESAASMGFLLDLPAAPVIQPGVPSVVLDRLQDAGNTGSVLRSASAFGFSQVIALKGTVALWSPKVLRAGMGAHFGLHVIEGVDADSLDRLDMPLVVTSSHAGDFLHRATLPQPCAWVLGHEGQGVAPELEARASQHIRIAQPGGEESLNVAAAAAICLHASSAQRFGGAS